MSADALRRAQYIERFNLRKWKRPDHWLTSRLLDMLDACKDDESRKVLLGIRT